MSPRAARESLQTRIAEAQQLADGAKKEAKLAKLQFRNAKQEFKNARRVAKKLRKAVKKLRAELATLAVRRRPRKPSVPTPEAMRPTLVAPTSATAESSPPPLETSPASVDRPPVDPST